MRELPNGSTARAIVMGRARAVVPGLHLEGQDPHMLTLRDLEPEGAPHARARRLHGQVAESSPNDMFLQSE